MEMLEGETLGHRIRRDGVMSCKVARYRAHICDGGKTFGATTVLELDDVSLTRRPCNRTHAKRGQKYNGKESNAHSD